METNEILDATGWNPKAWRVYLTSGRYNEYLEHADGGRMTVLLDPAVSEQEFRKKISQSKNVALERGGLAAPGRKNRLNEWVSALPSKPSKGHRFTIVSKPIGKGGFASVYLARANWAAATVAIKIFDDDHDAQVRGKREITIQRTLHHANIVTVLDAAPDHTWFTMPLADGDLEQLLSELSGDEFIQVVKSIAMGLEAAHVRGCVHRDVAPRNVLRMTAGGTATWVVADWGLVRGPRGGTTALHTQQGKRVGTADFMAPEMWNDAHAADARCDIYSLGRLLAWGLGGGKPMIPILPADAPHPWTEVVRRATSTLPSDRFATVREMLDAIEEVQRMRSLP